MTKREEYEQKTEKLLMPIMEANGFELVDVEYVKEAGNWYLRAYIDKPGGITVDDCEVVNRELGDLLDRDDFIDDSYILEVSSPGLGRPLKKERDFIRSKAQCLCRRAQQRRRPESIRRRHAHRPRPRRRIARCPRRPRWRPGPRR